jgi:hypothetical protein
MKKSISMVVQRIKTSLISLLLIGIVSSLSLFMIVESAHADGLPPEQALEEIRQDLATEDREVLYEEETAAVKDPKMGAQKQYEENLKEYKKENGKEGVVEKVKDLLTSNSQ